MTRKTHLAPDLLDGRTVLITGGGSGLGLTMARAFIDLGANLVLCGRRAALLDEVAAELRGHARSPQVRAIACDIRSGDAVEAMVKEAFDGGPPDILVNNAGANFIAQTERLSPRAADAVMAPSVHGALYCTMAVGRQWIDREMGGCVLSILSTSVFTGRAFTTPSAMAKAALLGMTRSLAVEWGGRGIRLVAIAPGIFPTSGATAQLRPDGRPENDMASRIPAGRVGDPAELAEVAAFLVSDAASYMTGEVVTLDGGAHLRTSGAEDLVAWSAEQWAEHRASLKR